MLEWIVDTISSLGYIGIGFLMLMENLFPPIPSELIMPFAGFAVSQHKLNFAYTVMAGVVGTVLGALPWYFAGSILGSERLQKLSDNYGKWLGISGEDVSKAKNWFDKHGTKAVFLCRLVPGVRTLISIPAGISQMPLIPFLVFSSLGTSLWICFLTYFGYVLGENYSLVNDYIGSYSEFVLGGLVIVFLAFVIVRKIRQAEPS